MALIGDITMYSRVVWGDSGLVEIRALSANGEGRPGQWWCPVDSVPVYVDLIESGNHEKLHIYAGVLPRTEEGYGDKNHVGAGRALWLDVDHTTPETVIAAFAADGGPLALPVPTMLINSGNGVHAYWQLTEPMEPPDIVRINRTIVHYAKTAMGLAGADPASTDSARIMRLPGTVNHKGGRMCHIHGYVPEAIESPAWWRQWVDRVAPTPPAPAREIVVAARGGGAKKNGKGRLTGVKRAYAYAAKMSGIAEGGRNGAAYRLACFGLFNCGLDEPTTLTLLKNWDACNQPPLTQTDGGPEALRRIVQNAVAYGGRE